ncbi:MAG: hypothetical protein JJD92_16715 [Frankiaceae bacterium]|nr:hypothetical protein [Frankiaceae bacterium]
MHNGPFTPSRPVTPCCSARPQVVSLTRDDSPGSVVELVRCSACGASTWLLDGQAVDKDRALGALSATFARRETGPRPRSRTAPTPTAAPSSAAPGPAAAEPDLAELLAGWSVLGAQR